MAISNKLGDDLEECADLNLTPFIDVILVLLIIFMVAAQASNVSQSVDLPGSNAKTTPPATRPVVVSIDARGTLSVNDRPTSRRELGRALAAAGARADDRLLLAADKTQTYQALMDIFDDLRAVGYTRVALAARER
ncbi:ExbD/TolR family protein [Sphingomonas sp. 2378]|uniref:ExbD/TolR family protein n=1 Tax=Sphingomonas sp. 2378 TaxID=1219748 RepID=UPI00311AC28F